MQDTDGWYSKPTGLRPLNVAFPGMRSVRRLRHVGPGRLSREFGGVVSHRCHVSVVDLVRLVEAVGVELTQDALAKAARGDGQRHA